MTKKVFLFFVLLASAITSCSFSSHKDAHADLIIAVDKNYVLYFQNIIRDFTNNKEYADMHIQLTVVDMFDYLDSLEKGNSSAPKADIFMMPADRIGLYVEQNKIAPITIDLASYTPTAVEAVTWNSMFYLLPMSMDTLVLIYDANKINRRPNTLAEINPNEWATNFTDLFHAFGLFAGYQEDFLYNGRLRLNGEGSIAAATRIQEWFNEDGNTFKNKMRYHELAGQALFDAFTHGDITYMINGSWVLSDLYNQHMNVDIMPVPNWSDEHQYQPLVGVKGLALSPHTENRTLALALLNHISSQENANKWHLFTNEISAHRGVFYSAGSMAKTLFDITHEGTAVPNTPYFALAWEPVNHALELIAQQHDVQEVLNQAQIIIDQNL